MQKKKARISKDHCGYLFIAPYFLAFLLFSIYPIFYTLRMSFFKWDGLSEPVFVGAANYARLLEDDFFLDSIFNTILISLPAIVFQLLFGLVLAFFLNQPRFRGGGFFKAVFYFPNLVTAISLGILFWLLFDWQAGGVNKVLMALNLISEPINWRMSAPFSRGIISFVLWFQYFGYYTIIFTAGAKGISQDVLEAAQIDGANRLQTFTRIMVPLLKPIITYAAITTIIGGMQIFDVNYAIGEATGKPGHATLSMVLYMYNQSFTNYNYGYGAAISYGLFILIIVFSAVYMRLTVGKEE